jgi:alpha-amylase/alpha-mannosidase (GH57 family)
MAVRPISLSQFLAENPPAGSVNVQTGAWNVGSTSGYDFSQWAGSDSQRKALEAIWHLSRAYQECTRSLAASRLGLADPALRRAREYILRAETSCYLFWGDAWIPKLYEEIRIAHQALDEVKKAPG